MAKLKRARGALLRAIRSGRCEPPPGYMGREEMLAHEREQERKRKIKFVSVADNNAK